MINKRPQVQKQFNPGGASHLGQLQNHSVIHVELRWHRLHQVGATDRNHPEAVPHHLQLLYGSHQVVSEKTCNVN